MNGSTDRDQYFVLTPLNWGLGHVSRSVPIVQTLLNRGHRVLLASDGDALRLLRAYFPNLKAVTLPSYGVRYSHRSSVLNGLRNLPGIWRSIRSEHRAIRTLSEQYDIGGIISDHRLGCWHPDLNSVLLAHQIRIPFRSKMLSGTITAIHRRLIHRFDALWIPDDPDLQLSGSMSATERVKIPCRHIGFQSALQPMEGDSDYRWLAVLSGPEPARSDFEKQVAKQFMSRPGRHCILRGKPGEGKHSDSIHNIDIRSLASGQELSRLIASADYVLCRSGYSGLMDMMVLSRKALIVPTPGQPEQEYLASRLNNSDHFVVQSQEDMDIQQAEKELEQMETVTGQGIGSEELLNEALDEFLINC